MTLCSGALRRKQALKSGQGRAASLVILWNQIVHGIPVPKPFFGRFLVAPKRFSSDVSGSFAGSWEVGTLLCGFPEEMADFFQGTLLTWSQHGGCPFGFPLKPTQEMTCPNQLSKLAFQITEMHKGSGCT